MLYVIMKYILIEKKVLILLINYNYAGHNPTDV